MISIKMEHLDDEELMRAYQLGDYSAFEELYRRVSPRVYGYLRARLKNPEERDEVFQNIFLKFHQVRAQYSIRYSFTQWAFVISKTVLLDHFRKLKRTPTELATSGMDEVEKIPTTSSQSEGLSAYQTIEELEASKVLTVEQKKVVDWRIMDELSYEEIASRLSRSQASVRQILSRALRKLRDDS